jgi:plastocyanin
MRPTLPRSTRLGLFLSAVAATGLACAAPAATNAPATIGSSTPSAASPTAGTAASPIVEMTGFAFQPATLQVKAGTTVQYVNKDATAHTVTQGQNGVAAAQAAFDEQVEAGATVTVTFAQSGTIQVTCKIHPTMNQTVQVSP